MRAFTPGPWVIAACPDTLVVQDLSATHGTHVVRNVAMTGYYAYGDTAEHFECVANARLIAAAPELLGELDIRAGDLVMLTKAIEAGDPKAELLIRVGDMLRETRAAIAKATGEA